MWYMDAVFTLCDVVNAYVIAIVTGHQHPFKITAAAGTQLALSCVSCVSSRDEANDATVNGIGQMIRLREPRRVVDHG